MADLDRPETDELLGIAEASALLGLKSRTGVHFFAREGRIPIGKIEPARGNQVRHLFWRSDLERLKSEIEYSKSPEGRRAARARELQNRIEGRTNDTGPKIDGKLALFFLTGKKKITMHAASANAVKTDGDWTKRERDESD